MYIRTYRFTNHSGCHCDDGCCIKTPSAPPGTDCSIYNTIGSRECNFTKGCQWICDCKNITDANVCAKSTCLAQPNLACTFNNTTGCSCPNCTRSCIRPLFLNQKTCKCECDINQECPSPKILDTDTCECRCPDGSIENTTTGNCTGNCTHFHTSELCKEIFCETNPSRLCTLTNRKCECPMNNVTIRSCDEISDPGECNRTVCPGTNFSPPIMCK